MKLCFIIILQHTVTCYIYAYVNNNKACIYISIYSTTNIELIELDTNLVHACTDFTHLYVI